MKRDFNRLVSDEVRGDSVRYHEKMYYRTNRPTFYMIIYKNTKNCGQKKSRIIRFSSNTTPLTNKFRFNTISPQMTSY